MAKAGRRARADFATADADLRSAPVAPLLGHPDRMIERLQWMTDTLDFASLIVGHGVRLVWLDQHGLREARATRLRRIEEVVLFHPAMRLFVNLLGVRFEHNPLPRAECSYIYHWPILLRQLVQIVVPELLGLQVNVLLCTPQGTEIPLHVLGRRPGLDQEADHEGGVHHLPKTLLLQHILLGAEHGRSLYPALQQEVHSVHGPAMIRSLMQ